MPSNRASTGDRIAATAIDLLRRWRAARRRLLRLQASRSAVHAWRILSRQLFAMEELLAPAVTGPQRARLRGILQDSFHATGKLRDSQFAVARLEELARQFPAATRLADKLRRDLGRRRRKTVTRVRAVAPRDLRRVVTSWTTADVTVGEKPAARARGRIGRVARRLELHETPFRSAKSLHQYRVRLKLLRYMSDVCRAMGVAEPSLALTATQMATLQHRLGTVTDSQVLLEAIAHFGRKHPAWRRSAVELQRHAQLERAAALRSLATATSTHVAAATTYGQRPFAGQ